MVTKTRLGGYQQTWSRMRGRVLEVGTRSTPDEEILELDIARYLGMAMIEEEFKIFGRLNNLTTAGDELGGQMKQVRMERSRRVDRFWDSVSKTDQTCDLDSLDHCMYGGRGQGNVQHGEVDDGRDDIKSRVERVDQVNA